MSASINFHPAGLFLHRLDQSAPAFTFQTFDDSKVRRKQRGDALKADIERIRQTTAPDLQGAAIRQARQQHRDPLAQIIEGSFEQVKDRLANLNAQGAGVYVTLNRTCLNGSRTAGSVISVRALCADLDGGPLSPVENCRLKPLMVTETSLGRYQAFWPVEGLPLKEFTRLQSAIASRFNADPSIKDLPRVVRLPGFLHNKHEPWQSRIHMIDGQHAPYTASEVLAEFLDGDTRSIIAKSAYDSGYALPGQIREGGRNTELLRLAGHLRGKGIEQGMIETMLLGVNQRTCFPPLEESEVLDIASRYNTAIPSEPVDWPPLQPIPESLPPAAPFVADDLLPPTLSPWVEDVADRMQCPIDYVGIAVIVALGSLLGSRIAIRPKAKDTWHEVPNLWGIIIGPSGVKKTPAISEALSFLRKLQEMANQKFKKDSLDYACAALVFKNQLSDKKKQHKAGSYELKPQDTLPPSPPVHRRYLINDATPEAIGVILQDNPGPLYFSDEIAAVLSRLEGEENRAARAFFLEAYNGKHSYTVDRITRDAVSIPRLCLSVLGSTQPDTLRAYLRHTVTNSTSNDGLMQRFQLSCFPEHPKTKPRFVDRAPNASAAAIARNVFIRFDALDPQTIGAVCVSGSQIPMLGFDPAVQPIVNQWLESVDRSLLNERIPPALTAHFSKYRKTITSLALILHLAAGNSGVITAPAFEMAKRWMHYLISHARRIYASVNRSHFDDARRLGQKIRAGQLKDGFTLRKVYQHGWAGLSKPETVKMALDILIDHGWLQTSEEKTGGRPLTRYWINPEIKKT